MDIVLDLYLFCPAHQCLFVKEEPGWSLYMRRPVIRLLNATLHSIVISSPHTSSFPFLAPADPPFVSTSVTCRHQLPIRQCNIRPILPACDWEILEWSKPTNLIYRASINKEIVPSLIALLNNGCLFGNHFPISQHFPLDWPSRVLFFFLFFSFVFISYFFLWSPLKQPISDGKIYVTGPNKNLCLFDPEVSGEFLDF